MKFDLNKSKRDIIRDAEAEYERMSGMINRQLDQINRLLGHELDGGDPTIPRYQHEFMHLNEQLSLADIRREAYEGVLRRIKQKIVDKNRAWTAGSVSMGHYTADFLTEIKKMIEEVMPDARPDHVDEGRPDDAGEAKAEARHAA